MIFNYNRNFSNFADNEHPDSIFVENYADHPNQLGYVLNGDYIITFPGNKHLLLTPELKDFSLQLDYEFNKLYARRQGMLIYLRYDKLQREGLVVYVKFEENYLEIEYGIQQELERQVIDRKRLPKADCSSLKLDAKGENLQLELAGHSAVFDIPLDYRGGQGLVGFDRDFFNGPLMLKNIRLEAECDDCEDEILWEDRCYEFPKAISAFDSEWKFTIGAKRNKDFSTIDIKLTGGPAEREKISGFLGLMPNEELVNPYIRIKNTADEQKFYIFKGKVGLVESWNREQPGRGRCDAQCPVERQIFLTEFSPDAKLFLGYEAYWREDRIDLDVALEMLIDPLGGKIIDIQEFVKPRAINIGLKSSGKKKIVSLIDKNDVRYAEAVEFAKNNHFFFESENCEFNFELMFNKRDYSKEEFEFSYQLEDVFHNPLAAEKKITLKSAGNDYDSMLERLESAIIVFDDLKIGVYHLTLRVGLFGGEFKRKTFAFEVLSENTDSPCPPIMSGLPALFSHCSDNNTNSDYFDPWLGKNSDLTHYFSNCCYTAPVARKFRIWDLVHVYQRKWFMWLKPRTTSTPQYKDNIEEIRNADYISFEKLSNSSIYDNGRIDLLIRTFYRDKLLGLLIDFLEQNKIQFKHLNPACLRETQELEPEAFNELISHNEIWKSWMLFIARWRQEEFLPDRVANAEKIKKGLRFIDYSFFPYYVATYRGAYSALYSGFDLRNIGDSCRNNIFFMEDYPLLIGNPMQRTIYSLSALKLQAPQVVIFPEIYSFCAVPRDPGVRYGSPPYGISFPPAATVGKRVFEYAYAACWYRAGKFAFWNDRGFHLRTPTRESMNVFLKSWNMVDRIKPRKPLRTIAFVTSVDSCLRHPDFNTEISYGYDDGWRDYINTAEEFPAYIYEQARLDGQLNGFLIFPEEITSLTNKDIHTLVLPPLSVLSRSQKQAIRKLYTEGVNLVCSECVDGLEDVFGVEKTEPEPVMEIHPADPMDEFGEMAEKHVDARCASSYRVKIAQAVLCGKDQTQNVLSFNQGKNASAVLFATAPTLIRRKHLPNKVSRGGAVISELVNCATKLVLRRLDSAPVKTTEGKLIGFEDASGNWQIIIFEDARPGCPQPINPLITICGRNIKASDISCDREFSIISMNSEKALLRMHLQIDDVAVITIKATKTTRKRSNSHDNSKIRDLSKPI